MSRLAMKSISLSLLLFSTVACTQPPAAVEMRGLSGRGSDNLSAYNSTQGFHGMPVVSNYNPYQPAPVYTNTTPQFVSQETYNDVYVPPVQRKDLPPPSKTAGAAPVVAGTGSTTSPFTAPAPVAVQAPADNSTRTTNPWKRPGDDQSANVPAAPNQQVASVDAETTAKVAELEPAAGKTAFMWPVSGKKIISGFGPKSGGAVNEGINIAMAEGEPIWASADGEVAYVGNEAKGYGTMVVLKHAGNKTTAYAHMSRAIVDKYDRVKQGDIIGYVGATGDVTTPQLHFAIREGKDAIDPLKYLPRNVAGL